MLKLLVTAGPLRSFQERNYRLLWTSEAAVRFGEQMQLLVLSWYVVTETGSPLLVGLFGALRYTGTLLGAGYGVLVDRSNRRALLVGGRAAFAVLAAAILLLSLADALEIWHVFVVTGFYGLVRSIDNITRQTVLGDVVRREELISALALTRTGSDMGQMLGPLLGGVLLSRYGMGQAFAVIVAVYVMAAVASYLLRLANSGRSLVADSVWRNLAEGGGYIRRHDAVLALMLFAFLINLAAFPLTHGLMPVFARDVLHTGPMGLAVLSAAAAAGAFAGSIALASRRGFARPGILATVAVLCWFGSLLMFSVSPWMASALVVLLAVGVSQSASVVGIDSLLLRLTPAELRGRIMGVRSMAVYGLPVGLLLIGALAGAMGAPAAVAISAAVGAALTLLITIRLKELWSWR